LQRLFFGGSMSRQQLVEATGLSAGTVTTVVNGLLGQGLLIEAGTEDSDGGRPRILLEVARDRAVAVGVDVGETRVRIEAFDLSLRKIAGEDRLVTTLDLAPERAVDAIVNGIEALLRRVGADLCSVAGVGVGVSGIVEDREGLVHAASIGWQAVPFASLLRRQTTSRPAPSSSRHCRHGSEQPAGAGRGVPNAAVALLGTGVGAAVFTDGQLYRGAHSSAGEWGHVPVAVGGRICRCGSRGCLEAYVGGWAIAQRWRDMVGGPAGDQEAALGAFAAAIGVDPRADELADEFAEYLGAGLGTLVNLFNPERIVVAGWVGLKLGPALLQRIRDHTRSYALRRPYEQVEIVLGQLGADAVALGAATLVVDGILVGDLPVPARGKRPDEAARVALPA
jgi:predicted NBD/HSP70 family sugar kinase